MTSLATTVTVCAAICEHVLAPKAFAWLQQQVLAIAEGDVRCQATAIALAPRHSGKSPVQLSEQLVEPLYDLVPGADCSRWTADQYARLFILLHIPAADERDFVRSLDQLFRCADVAEALALYQSLPFLPHPSAHLLRAREGMRSNQLPLVAAVALDNPYPRDHFDEAAWNQLILKCLFVALPLLRVVGLEQRYNPRLSTMLIDYAAERRSAARPIPSDLWRAAAPCATAEQLAFISATLDAANEPPRGQAAAALALVERARHAPGEAEDYLAAHPAWRQRYESGELSWGSIAALDTV
jgi:hypothetical protein